jgi:hypothetical protein
MAELKTKPTAASVKQFLANIPDAERRRDCQQVARLMKRVTGAPARMWGPSIVGFGSYHYVYASGREGDWPLTGFSPRKQALVLYIMSGFARHAALVKKLGRIKTGKSCLYVKSLSDLDLAVLEELIEESVASLRKRSTARPA